MIGKLSVSVDGIEVGDFDLTKSSTSIGRKSDNDIVVNYALISSRHCKIITVSSDWFLEDLNSTNGISVNGKTIKKAALSNNDVIAVGNCYMKFTVAAVELQEVVDDDDDDDDATVMMASPSQAAAAAQQSHLTIPTRPADTINTQIKGRLQILNGANSGKEMELKKQLTTIGKPKVQVAAITKRHQGYYIIHVDGEPDSFPTVNGQSIGTQAKILSDHDLIEVAGIKMEFFLAQ